MAGGGHCGAQQRAQIPRVGTTGQGCIHNRVLQQLPAWEGKGLIDPRSQLGLHGKSAPLGSGGPHEEDPRTLRAKARLAKSQEYSARTPHLLAYLKVSGRDMPCLGSGIGEAGILECLLNILVWCQSVHEVIRAVTL